MSATHVLILTVLNPQLEAGEYCVDYRFYTVASIYFVWSKFERTLLSSDDICLHIRSLLL
jgi:hypothetical protein